MKGSPTQTNVPDHGVKKVLIKRHSDEPTHSPGTFIYNLLAEALRVPSIR